MRKFALASALVAFVMQPIAAIAGTRDFSLQGYALPADKPVTIVLMRPDVTVGELAAGGMPQPNADWTSAAREQITQALRQELAARNISFTLMEEQVPAYLASQQATAKAACIETARAAAAKAAADAAAAASVQPAVAPAALAPVPAPAVSAEPTAEALAACDSAPAVGAIDAEARVADYNALHSAVVQAILAHQYGLGGGKLPTKKDNFAYTLGPDTAQLGQVSGGNYGLFVMTVDQFASDSRKAMQVMGALGCIIGACVIVGGGIHVAYVSLVDLDTGNIVWFNLLRGSQGDVREPEGARGMVSAILANMPSRPGELVSAAAAPAR